MGERILIICGTNLLGEPVVISQNSPMLKGKRRES